jgi:hypothetical protein
MAARRTAASGHFHLEARPIMRLSRDWWAVVVAITAALFVKIGALPHVPW